MWVVDRQISNYFSLETTYLDILLDNFFSKQDILQWEKKNQYDRSAAKWKIYTNFQIKINYFVSQNVTGR